MPATKSIVHLSDPHFGTENALVISALLEAISQIKPDVLVVSGDLTQRAHRTQFRSAKNFLDAISADHKLVIPGNHDIPLFNIPLRFLNPYRNFQQFFSMRQPTVLTENVLLAGLDASTPYHHTRGKLDVDKTRERLNYLCANRVETQLLGLVIHQPIVVARKTDVKNLLINYSELCQLFSEYKVDFVLSGHIHFPLICSVLENIPHLPWGTIFSGAGTAISHRVRDNISNSFNSLIISNCGNEILIRRLDFDEEKQKFLDADSKMFGRSVLGWARL